ncbi:unnamed protein product, partial [Ectocarpus fasciculatus]
GVEGDVGKEETRKRGAEAQVEEDGGGGSASGKGGEGEETHGGESAEGGEVVEPRGQKKKKLDEPSELPLKMVKLAEKYHDQQKQDFESSKRVLEKAKGRYNTQEDLVKGIDAKLSKAQNDSEVRKATATMKDLSQKEEKAEQRVKDAENKRVQYERLVKKEKASLEEVQREKAAQKKELSALKKKYGGDQLAETLGREKGVLMQLKTAYGEANVELFAKRKNVETARSALITAQQTAGIQSLPLPEKPSRMPQKTPIARQGKGGGGEGSRKGGDTQVAEMKGTKAGKEYTIPKRVPSSAEASYDRVYKEMVATYPDLDGAALAGKVKDAQDKDRRAAFDAAMRRKDGEGYSSSRDSVSSA